MTRRFCLLHRNKWITSNVKTIEDMIAIYEGLAKQFSEMREEGVTLDPDSSISDDYAVLVTTNPETALKYEFEDERLFSGQEEEPDPEDVGVDLEAYELLCFEQAEKDVSEASDEELADLVQRYLENPPEVVVAKAMELGMTQEQLQELRLSYRAEEQASD